MTKTSSSSPAELIIMGAIGACFGLVAIIFPSIVNLNFYRPGLQRYADTGSNSGLRLAVRLIGFAIFVLGVVFIYLGVTTISNK